VRRAAVPLALLAGAGLLVAAAVLFRLDAVELVAPVEGRAGDAAISQIEAVADPSAGQALTRFAKLARERDYEQMWRGVTTETKQRLTFPVFRTRLGPDLSDEIGSLSPGSYRVVTSLRTADGVGIASLAGTRVDATTGLASFETYGYGLVKEDGRWRLELLTEVGLELLSPDQSLPTARAAVAVSAVSRTPVIDAGVWIDGEHVESSVEGSEPTNLRIFSEEAKVYARGDHTIVAAVHIASVGGRTPVVGAWTFVGSG